MYTYLYEGLRKDLKNAVKTESGSCGSSILQDWITAIISHLYWVLTSVCTTLTNRADILDAKLKSLLNHITNTLKPNAGLKRRCTYPQARFKHNSIGVSPRYIATSLPCQPVSNLCPIRGPPRIQPASY